MSSQLITIDNLKNPSKQLAHFHFFNYNCEHLMLFQPIAYRSEIFIVRPSSGWHIGLTNHRLGRHVGLNHRSVNLKNRDEKQISLFRKSVIISHSLSMFDDHDVTNPTVASSASQTGSEEEAWWRYPLSDLSIQWGWLLQTRPLRKTWNDAGLGWDA